MPGKEEKLAFEHGFSAWVELDDKKILFDTGQTGAFTENAEQLGIVTESGIVLLVGCSHVGIVNILDMV